jgi:hypothetical protein
VKKVRRASGLGPRWKKAGGSRIIKGTHPGYSTPWPEGRIPGKA